MRVEIPAAAVRGTAGGEKKSFYFLLKNETSVNETNGNKMLLSFRRFVFRPPLFRFATIEKNLLSFYPARLSQNSHPYRRPYRKN